MLVWPYVLEIAKTLVKRRKIQPESATTEALARENVTKTGEKASKNAIVSLVLHFPQVLPVFWTFEALTGRISTNEQNMRGNKNNFWNSACVLHFCLHVFFAFFGCTFYCFSSCGFPRISSTACHIMPCILYIVIHMLCVYDCWCNL